jgi:hypothetical protein
MPPSRSPGRLAAWGIVYGAAVAWLAWPLPRYLATRLAYSAYTASFDLLYAGWALAWETHALATAPARLADANIFHPASSTLFYGPTAFGALPLFAPVLAATGSATVATNVTWLLGIALTALGAHRVVWRWTGADAAAAAAGAVVATSPFLWGWVATAPQYAVLVYLPWIVFLAAAPLGRGRAVALLVLVALQAATEPVYVAPAIIAPLALLAVARLARAETRRDGVALLAVVAGAIAALAPVYAGYARVWRENPHLASQTPWPNAQLVQFLSPMTLTWRGIAGAGTTDVPSLVIAVILVGAACARAASREIAPAAWRHATLWTVLGFLLATPTIVVAGTIFWTPHYRLARAIAPAAAAIARIPSRFGVIALVGVALLTGLAVASCGAAVARLAGSTRSGRVARGVLALALCAFLYGGRWLARHPLPTMPVPALDEPVLRALRGGDGPVVEVPVQEIDQRRMTLIAREHAVAMYRSIAYWRPLVNGYSSYWPAGFPERVALAAALPDPAALAALRAATGLDAVIVRAAELPPTARTTWLALADAGGRPDLRLVARGEHDLLFTTGGS